MEQVLHLIGQYGVLIYALLFAYCALKSGSLPLFAGYAAYAGALDVSVVAAATFLGGYLGDEARFAIARKYGTEFVEARPRLAAYSQTAKAMLERYGLAYMFLYRYPKGMRTVGALPVGLTDITWPRFTLLNSLSAALWTVILVGCGYVFGSAIEQAVKSGWGPVSVILLVLFGLAGYLAWRQTARLARP